MRKPLLRVLIASFLLASGAAVLWAGLEFVDVPVEGKKLLIKDNVDTTKRKALYLSKDPSFSTAGIDPTVDGAVFFLFGQSPFRIDDFDMPAAGWIEKKPGEFVYEDEDQLNGPIVKAKLKNGLVQVLAVGTSMTYTLLDSPDGQGPISAHVVTGDAFICTVFPGAEGTVKKNDAEKGLYLATNAEAPAMSCEAILD